MKVGKENFENFMEYKDKAFGLRRLGRFVKRHSKYNKIGNFMVKQGRIYRRLRNIERFKIRLAKRQDYRNIRSKNFNAKEYTGGLSEIRY